MVGLESPSVDSYSRILWSSTTGGMQKAAVVSGPTMGGGIKRRGMRMETGQIPKGGWPGEAKVEGAMEEEGPKSETKER